MKMILIYKTIFFNDINNITLPLILIIIHFYILRLTCLKINILFLKINSFFKS